MAAILIELLAVLIIVCSLHILVSGFELTISPVEIVAWAVGGLFAVFGSRFLVNKIAESWTGGPGRHKRGPAAEGLDRLRKGDLRGGELLLRRCLERHPADTETLRGLAEIAFRRDDFEQYLHYTSRMLGQPDELRRSDRVALCHRQADVCLERLNDPQRAVEALARLEVDYPGTTDALRARQRIERILSTSTTKADRDV